MTNKNLFNTSAARIPETDSVNNAGGKAYDTGAEHSLAQYACTGMFGGTYYTSPSDELDKVIALAKKVSPKFLAKTAIYARQQAFMKDMPAVLLAVLSTQDPTLFRLTFPKVINNGKMLSTFIQIIRSGKVGRKSLGSAPRKAIRKWIESSSADYLYKQSAGNNPSLVDIIKLAHPRPSDLEQDGLFSYLLNGEYSESKKYPSLVHEYEAFKAGKPGHRKVPDLPFQMLTSQNLSDDEWKEIAKNGNWHFTRMNLNNFQKHNVLNDSHVACRIAIRLADKHAISKNRVFPYQVFQTIKNVNNLPRVVEVALHNALDLSLNNVPKYAAKTHVAVDCSGSMMSPINGNHFSYKGNKVTCNEVASLFASALYRTNDCDVYRFDYTCEKITNTLNPTDSVFTNAKKINRNGGATNCSSFLSLLNKNKETGDLVVMISDNESWYEACGLHSHVTRVTDFQQEWSKYKSRNKNAVLVCIDITPGRTSQAVGKDVLLVGGFSDTVFTVINSFLESRGDSTFWVKEIEKVSLS